MNKKLSPADKGLIRKEYLEAPTERGIVNKLAEKYDVHRSTISHIIHSTRKLRKATEEVQAKAIEKKTLELQIDTYRERVEMIHTIKALDIVPVLRKLQTIGQLRKNGKKTDKIIITDKEKDRLKEATTVIENMLRGIDQIHKVDIHFHVHKIMNFIEDMDAETTKIFTPTLKRFLCEKCPLYMKYNKRGK